MNNIDKDQMDKTNYIHKLMIRRKGLERHRDMTTDPMIKGAIEKTILEINKLLK